MSAETEKSPVKGKVAVGEKVLIHRSDLISDRLEEVIDQLLAYFPNTIMYGIVFDENGLPVDKKGEADFAVYYIPVCSMVVNLQQHFDSSLAGVEAEDNNLSLGGLIWLNLMLTLLHEIKHGIDLMECEDVAKFSITDKDCERAQDWAYEMIMRCAASGKVDFSMPDMLDDPYFGKLVSNAYDTIIDGMHAGDTPWHKLQAMMFEKNLCYSYDGVDTGDFMEYLKHLNNGKVTWVEKVKPLAEAVEDLKVEAKPEAAPEPPATPAPQTLASEVPAVVVATSVISDGVETAAEPAVVTPVDEPAPFDPYASGVDYGDEDELPGEPMAELQVNPHGLEPMECRVILAHVAHRMYAHIFNKCGMQLGMDVGFSNPGAVVEPCYIGDIPNVEKLIISYDSVNENGQFTPHIPVMGNEALADGHVRGILTSKAGLPSFTFYINANGFLMRRTLIVQNCNKRNGEGELTAWAKQAREGVCIALMYRDVSDVDKANGLEPILATIMTQAGQPAVVSFDPFSKSPQNFNF